MTRKILPVILTAGLMAANIGLARADDASQPQSAEFEQFKQQSQDAFKDAF